MVSIALSNYSALYKTGHAKIPSLHYNKKEDKRIKKTIDANADTALYKHSLLFILKCSL